MKQTSEKIIAAAEERGWINENEILLLKRRRNRGERIQIENPIPVSYDQAQKGFAWLWDKYRTPRGAERKNNPFTNPEEKALIFSKNEQEFIVEQMRRVGIEVYAATEHFVTCKGNSWVPYAVAVAKRANAKVEVFKEPTGGFCYKFQPDLGSWTCVDSHRITFMRHNKIEKRFERLRVKDVDDKYTRYINWDQTKQGEYIPLRLKIYRSESWEYTEIEEAAVEAFLKDNGDNYIPEEVILAADFLMP